MKHEWTNATLIGSLVLAWRDRTDAELIGQLRNAQAGSATARAVAVILAEREGAAA